MDTNISLFGLTAIFGAIAVGVTVQTMVGAGLSIICAPVVLLMAPVNAAVQVLLCINFAAAALSTLRGFHKVPWTQVAQFLSGCSQNAYCLRYFRRCLITDSS